MSSIPNSAMPHAHVHHDDPAPEAVERSVSRLIDTVKSYPRTGIAVGASLVIGAVAAVALPRAAAKRVQTKRSPAKAKTKAASRRKKAA